MNYEIKNKFIQVKINSFGAELNSLKRVDTNLEYLWQGNPQYWNRHSPVLFPIVGRLKDDSYFYKNKKYSMTQHGFARDNEFSLTKQTDNYLEFKLENNEKSLEIYPFLFELYIGYELVDNKIIISYKVKNNSNEKMLFSIGAHPAFNWALNENEKKEDYFLEFENIKEIKRYFLNDKGLVYESANLEIKENKMFLTEKLFQQDALVFNDINIKNITLKNINNQNFVKVNFDNFTYLGIWSKPTGAPFICIEPWYGVADDINTNQNIENKKGMISLEKYEVFSTSYNIEL
jgi:galactose mutarotase-like enzyme